MWGPSAFYTMISIFIIVITTHKAHGFNQHLFTIKTSNQDIDYSSMISSVVVSSHQQCALSCLVEPRCKNTIVTEMGGSWKRCHLMTELNNSSYRYIKGKYCVCYNVQLLLSDIRLQSIVFFNGKLKFHIVQSRYGFIPLFLCI